MKTRPLYRQHSAHSCCSGWSHEVARDPIILFEGNDWSLTLREAIFSVLIAGIMTAVGFLISSSIANHVHNSQLKYKQALQIDKSLEQFAWALKTDVGHAFVEGRLEVLDPVEHKDLDGKWSIIEAAHQMYQRHTRVVHYTTHDSKGRARVRTRTETYWSWDTVSCDHLKSKKAKFLGVDFELSRFEIIGIHWTRKTVKTGINRRTVFNAAPTSMNGTAFTKLESRNISHGTSFWVGQHIKECFKNCTESCLVEVFWVFWIMFTVVVIAAFFIIDNKWLEDGKQ